MPILTMEQTILTWIHLISASIWVGGSLFIGFILSPILRSSSISSNQRFQIMVNIGKRFNKIALPALILLIITGIYKSQNILFDIDLSSINYGSILFLKIIFVLSLIISFFIHVHIINTSLVVLYYEGCINQGPKLEFLFIHSEIFLIPFSILPLRTFPKETL